MRPVSPITENIGAKPSEAAPSFRKEKGYRVNATAGHPALIAHRSRSPLWRVVSVKRHGIRPTSVRPEGNPDTVRWTGTLGRAVGSFEHVGS